jgi:hypothetical protein
MSFSFEVVDFIDFRKWLSYSKKIDINTFLRAKNSYTLRFRDVDTEHWKITPNTVK